MAKFTVRNRRNEDGTTYTLSYGRKPNHATAIMARENGKWRIVGGQPAAGVGDHARMRDCKAAWGAWAETVLCPEQVEGPPAAPPPVPPMPPHRPPAAPPPHRPAAGPPQHRPPQAPGTAAGEHAAQKPDLVRGQYSDPFSPRMRYPADHPVDRLAKQLTPLGVLAEIDAWYRRHASRLQKINAALAEKHPPGYDPFEPLIDGVRSCLRLHLSPDDMKDQNNAETEQTENTPDLNAAFARIQQPHVGPPEDLDNDSPF